MIGEERDGLPIPRRYGAIAAIWLATAMALIDTSIANVALPTIAADLGASPQSAIWVVNAYQIAIVMLILPLASLGEKLGYRRVYGAGVLLFVVASVGCTFANSLTTLACARFVQGFGAAGLMALNGALIRFTYPKAMLGRGVGYNGLVVAISSAVGPSIAAMILALGSWRWLFAVNVPIGLLSFAIGQRCLPVVGGSRGRFGFVSAGLNAAMFATAFLAASDVSHGYYGVGMVAELAMAILFGALLVQRVRDQANPLIPLDLLRIGILRLSYATSISSFAAQMMAMVALPFYLQQTYRVGHVELGLLITLWPLGLAVAAPVSGRMVERVPAGLLGGVGLAVMATGLAGIALLPVSAGAASLAPVIALCGAGFGFFQTPNNRVLLGTAPASRSGAAAGMLATCRTVGQTTGAVIVALMFRLTGPGGRVVFAVDAAIAVIAAVISLSRLAKDGEALRWA